MLRRFTPLFLVGFLGVVSWLMSAAPPAISHAPVPGKANTLRVPTIRPGEELADKLRKVVDWGGADDPKFTLQDILEQLGKVYHITFYVNEKAFQDEKCTEVLKLEIANPYLLPLRASLAFVLKRILSRVDVKSGATYLIRSNLIEITTGDALRAEIWGRDYTGPRLPLICITADRKPLDEVVAFLAEQGERNIAIDPRVGDKAQAPISTYMINKPLDSALFLVADMAGLAYVQIDNTYYLTTPDRVASMKENWKTHRPVSSAPKKSEAPEKTAEKPK
jgi:hypothetical protein